MRKLILLIVFFSLTYALSADSDSSSVGGAFSIIAKDDGLRFIFNAEDGHFQFDLKCNEFKPIEAANMIFMADDFLLQITPVPLNEVIGKNHHKYNDSLALLYHFAYQARAIRSSISGKYKILPEFAGGDSSQLLYLWQFDMPKKDYDETDTLSHRVVKQMYATGRFGNYILMLSSALIDENNPQKVKRTFIETLNSVRVSPTPIDPEIVRKTLIEEAKKKQDESTRKD